nr:gliding motility-associated C-terminal domain-containing protein [uncultured Draconibacterium sp.]
MKNKFAYLFIVLSISSYITFGQTKQNTKALPSKEQSINFERKTGIEEIIINVKEQTPILNLLITGSISSGKLNVKIIDPHGETIKSFSINRKGFDKNSDIPIGKIRKFQKDPEPGNWKVEIATTRAYGNISVVSEFEKDYNIDVPKNFTPDGNGINDTFKIETYNISEIAALKIYDRYGKMVFSTKNKNEGWDGKVNGKQPVPGTYFYFVTAKTFSGEEVSQGGYLTLSGKGLKTNFIDELHFMLNQ